MDTRVLLGMAGLASTAVLIGQLQVGAEQIDSKRSRSADEAVVGLQTGGSSPFDLLDDISGLNGEISVAGGIGPDVVVWDIFDFVDHGMNSGGTIRAYSFGTISCNLGDQQLLWKDFDLGQPSNQHPVISQNMYRYDPELDRLEQIGQSWLKHGFCALDGNVCTGCNFNGNCDFLGVGCSDPYGAFLNGDQPNLGPKSDVNASTGVFPFPFTSPPFSGNTARRLQVKTADIDQTVFSTSKFYIESQYITADDAGVGNDNNNTSYRRIGLNPDGTLNAFLGATNVGQTALSGWQLFNNQVIIRGQDVPGDGRFFLAFRTENLGNGTWEYEYALYNMNSDRSCGSFAVPVPDNVTVLSTGFHDVDYHSGEPWDGGDWTAEHSGGFLTWSPPPFNIPDNRNALRWGTMYNFRFVANAPPRTTDQAMRIFLFKLGLPDFINIFANAPDGNAVVEPSACPADCAAPADGVVGVSDLLQILADWGLAGSTCDTDGDNVITVVDLLTLLGAWGLCP